MAEEILTGERMKKPLFKVDATEFKKSDLKFPFIKKIAKELTQEEVDEIKAKAEKTKI